MAFLAVTKKGSFSFSGRNFFRNQFGFRRRFLPPLNQPLQPEPEPEPEPPKEPEVQPEEDEEEEEEEKDQMTAQEQVRC